MKKALIILALISATSFIGKAQLYYFGAKTGLVFTHMTKGYLGKSWEDRGGTKYLAGVSFDYFVNDYFSLAPELLFFRKGTEKYKHEDSNTIETRSDIYKFSYLQLPLTVKAKIPFDRFNLFGMAGPYVAFLMGGMASEQGTAIIGKREMILKDFFEERKQDFTRFDIGFDLGAGAEIDAGPGRVLLQLRYDIGFIAVAKDQAVSPYQYKSFGANRAWSIEAGYILRFD
ncbi:MAG TPA: porin family protein [Bacteroidia bacterium]|nr:porin family protein [Bacteroidia bacterium]HRS58715.1 porin family protein [Bacteroidia bacterium]